MAEIITKSIGSDLSGVVVAEAEAWKAHVESHPDRPEAATARLDLTADEAEAIAKNGLRTVRLRLIPPGDGEETEVVVDAKKFDAMFKMGKKAVEVLDEAPVVGKRVKAANGSGDTGRDYGTLEWAGTPKKGKTSPEEARVVRENFDEVNARLTKDGMRPIDLNNSEHVARYGLEKLAAERKANPASVAEPTLPLAE